MTTTGHDPSTGKLPDWWSDSTIGEECKVVSGATPKTSVSEYWEGNIGWLTPDDLSKTRAKYVSAGRRSLTAAGYDSCSTRLVPPGSVLFTSRAPIGYVAIAADEICTNQGFKTAVPSSSLSSEFLYWQFQSVTPDIQNRASGTTFKEINAKGFSATRIVVPPLAEQARIVEILEGHLSRLDAALQHIQTLRGKAAQFRRSLLHAAFTGALTGHDPSTGKLPNGWRIAALGELVDQKADIVDGPFGSNLKSSHYTESGARVIRLQNIGFGRFRPAEAFISHEHFETLKSHNATEGDLLFSSLGENLPRACLAPDLGGPAIVKADCIRVRLSESVNRRFILHSTQRPEANEWADAQMHGMGRPRLGLGAIREFPVPLPPLAEQAQIVEILEGHLSRLDAAMAVADAVEERAWALRRSLLHAAFTGKLTEKWREQAHV